MKNVCGVDRILRLLVGIALVALAVVPSAYQTPWGWVGLVPLITAAIGVCPAYLPFKFRSCPGGSADTHAA